MPIRSTRCSPDWTSASFLSHEQLVPDLQSLHEHGRRRDCRLRTIDEHSDRHGDELTIAARRRIGVTAALAALVVLLVLISLGIGPVRLSPVTVIDALFGGGSDVQQVIVREIRLPRTILALAIGAILGLSGAALQGLLRNPLASPSLFGAPQSAAFGAVLVIALGLADVRSYALPVAAIIAAFASVFVLLDDRRPQRRAVDSDSGGAGDFEPCRGGDGAGDEPVQQSLRGAGNRVLAARLAGRPQFSARRAGAAVHRRGRDHPVQPAQRLPRAQPRRGNRAKPWRRCRPVAAVGDRRRSARRRRRGRRVRHHRLHRPGRAASDAAPDRPRSGAAAAAERAHRRGAVARRRYRRAHHSLDHQISRSAC